MEFLMTFFVVSSLVIGIAFTLLYLYARVRNKEGLRERCRWCAYPVWLYVLATAVAKMVGGAIGLILALSSSVASLILVITICRNISLKERCEKARENLKEELRKTREEKLKSSSSDRESFCNTEGAEQSSDDMYREAIQATIASGKADEILRSDKAQALLTNTVAKE